MLIRNKKTKIILLIKGDINYHNMLTIQVHLNTETIFDTYIARTCILNYGCELRSIHAANIIEKVHLEYIKSVLSVKKNTNTAVVYF